MDKNTTGWDVLIFIILFEFGKFLGEILFDALKSVS